MACSPKLDRSIRPTAAPAPSIQIGEIESFELDNGLKVFVVENHKIPRVSFAMVFDNDPLLEGPSAGLTQMAGNLLGTGTTNRTKDEIDAAVDFIGASLNTSASGVSGTALTKHAPTLVDLMADVVMNPAFNQDEFDKAKTQFESNLAQAKDDPNSIASNVRSVLNYGENHPYGELMTEKTLENISLEACQMYANTFLKPNVAYLAIVGDISKEEAQAMVQEKFGTWEKGQVPSMNLPKPEPVQNTRVAFVAKRGAAQSVINITRPVDLSKGDDDLIKADVMNAVLGGGSNARLFKNLRETYGYTYGAYSGLSEDEFIGSFTASASCRNEVTDSAITQFLYELDQMRTTTVDPSELQGVINNLTGTFARSLENPATVAGFAINIDRYGLSKDYYQTYLQRLAAVTPEDVKAMAEKYLNPENMTILVVGSEEEVLPTLDKFGEVEVFDIYGKPFVDLEPAPEGMTAADVFQAYADAIGGAKNLERVKDLKSVASASVQGFSLNLTTVQKAPNLYKMEMTMGGNVMQKQVFNGKEGVSISMQGKQKLEGEDLKEMALQSELFPELKYETLGYTTELEGIADLNGTRAYRIKLTNPTGGITYEYYALETGFKVLTETDNGSQSYQDYKKVGGIAIPHKIVMNTGGQTINVNMEEVKVNSGIKSSEFSLD